MSIKFVDDFELYSYPFLTLTYFTYYFSELINLAWWFNFILQLNWYSNPEDVIADKLFRVKKYEKGIMAVLPVFAVINILYIMVMLILVFIQDCSDCHSYFHFDLCKGQCYSVGRVFKTGFQVLIFLGLVLITCLIVLGFTLLFKMRRNLNFFYQEKKIPILLTILLTSIATAWRSCYTFFTEYVAWNDLKYNYAARKNQKDEELLLNIIICAIDIYLPMAILMFNIKTINFQKYIQKLIKGWNYHQPFTNSSLFIMKNSRDSLHEEDSIDKQTFYNAKRSPNLNRSENYLNESQESSYVLSDDEDEKSSLDLYKKEFERLQAENAFKESVIVDSTRQSTKFES